MMSCPVTTPLVVAMALCGIMCPVALAQYRTVNNREPQYRHFDDYLISVSQPRAYNEALKDTGNADPTDQPEEHSPDRAEDPRLFGADVLGYFRDVPREHWSCCMLGKLAGDKGFHCTAQFYAVRIARHNYNRAHTRRMLFHGPSPIINWGTDLMLTFSRCIGEHAQEFHDCCYTATIERDEIRRWSIYRQTGRSVSGPRD